MLEKTARLRVRRVSPEGGFSVVSTASFLSRIFSFKLLADAFIQQT